MKGPGGTMSATSAVGIEFGIPGIIGEKHGATADGSEVPNNHLGWLGYLLTSTGAGFLNHQCKILKCKFVLAFWGLIFGFNQKHGNNITNQKRGSCVYG